ncbi:hypothetical protein GCM10009689_31870 [Brevibacterium antiquum]|uniref:hypothetical protein n=1 Tax=Brevibacterium antiquum TaxID=234835 RepID=UPI0018DF7962|nr:hypothetical protein [Brevibacterium antiquum]
MSTTVTRSRSEKRPLGAKRAILASSFGNLMESYDNLVYGYLAISPISSIPMRSLPPVWSALSQQQGPGRQFHMAAEPLVALGQW